MCILNLDIMTSGSIYCDSRWYLVLGGNAFVLPFDTRYLHVLINRCRLAGYFSDICWYGSNPKSSTPLPTWLIILFRREWHQGTSVMWYWLDGKICDEHQDGYLSNNPLDWCVLAAKSSITALGYTCIIASGIYVCWFGGLGDNFIVDEAVYCFIVCLDGRFWLRIA